MVWTFFLFASHSRVQLRFLSIFCLSNTNKVEQLSPPYASWELYGFISFEETAIRQTSKSASVLSFAAVQSIASCKKQVAGRNVPELSARATPPVGVQW